MASPLSFASSNANLKIVASKYDEKALAVHFAFAYGYKSKKRNTTYDFMRESNLQLTARSDSVSAQSSEYPLCAL